MFVWLWEILDWLFEGSVNIGACFGGGSFTSMSSSGVTVCISPSNRCFFGHLNHNTPSPTLKSTYFSFFVLAFLSECGKRREGVKVWKCGLVGGGTTFCYSRPWELQGSGVAGEWTWASRVLRVPALCGFPWASWSTVSWLSLGLLPVCLINKRPWIVSIPYSVQQGRCRFRCLLEWAGKLVAEGRIWLKIMMCLACLIEKNGMITSV